MRKKKISKSIVNKNNISYLLILIFLFILIFSCRQSTNPTIKNKYKIKEFNLLPLEYKEMPYTNSSTYPLDRYYPKDSDGVIMFNFEGKYYYHPVQIAQRMILFIDSFSLSGNPEYLRRAELFAKKLVELGVVVKDAIFFPYPFDFPLHGNKSETMKAPWYSCMAQGQALSGFVRLYQFTENEEYLEVAKEIYRSFAYTKNEIYPWITLIDEKSYLWFEEYPWEEDPNHTLNGFIFGIYGLYEYYQVTKDENCKKLIFAGLTTIEAYIDQFRVPGDLSYYCLKHKVQSVKYHGVHTEQLEFLYKFTGYEFFKVMHDRFYEDYH